MHEKLLTRKEAAAYLGISYRTLGEWSYKSIGPNFIKIGKFNKYSLKDLNEYIEKNRIFPRG